MYFALVLIGLALFERLVVDLGPNIELVTMASVLAGGYLTGYRRLVVPIMIMLISDRVLGWGAISWFTWSGFLVMTLMPIWWRRAGMKTTSATVLSGLSGVLFFYGWTNFGVWATDGWGMYSRDLSGLMMAYVNGLPFLRLQLISTMLFVPLGVAVVEAIKSRRYLWGNRNQVRLVGTSSL